MRVSNTGDFNIRDFFRYVLRLSRPRFWIYVAGPYLLATAISGYSNIYSLQSIIHLLYFLVFGNLFIYGVNDIFDKETDIKNPKKHSREAVVKEKYAYFAVIIATLISLTFLIFQKDWNSRFLFLGFIFFSLEYSAPPLRFKSIPFLDSWSNVLYLFPAYLAYYQFTGELVPLGIVILTIAWTSSMHLFSAIPDISFDRKAGINTTATVLGKKGSLLLCAVYWAIFSSLAILYIKEVIAFLLIIYPLIPLVLVLFFSKQKQIEKTYWYFPYLNFFTGMIFTIYFIAMQIL